MSIASAGRAKIAKTPGVISSREVAALPQKIMGRLLIQFVERMGDVALN
jgi:hypothetical protein